VNEMLLTGEPEDVAKNTVVKMPIPGHPEKLTADNMAFSSCSVKSGTCTGIIVATGMKTRVGSIAALLNSAGGDEEMVGPDAMEKGSKPKKQPQSCIPAQSAQKSPLQVNLDALAVKIGYLAIGICTFVFIVGAAMGTKDPEAPETPSWLFMILVAVTLTVAAIPEGLPLCVTIALSSGCSQMVRYLAGRKDTRRSEKAKVSEEALFTEGSEAERPVNVRVQTYTRSQTPNTQLRGLWLAYTLRCRGY